MAYVVDIPDDELQQFEGHVHIYSKGKIIIQEGDTHDRRIFLLRQGEVEVKRLLGEEQQVLGNIKAVNFFGEMSAISKRARTASITALSDPVVIYAFEKPNLAAILKDPRWSTLLIKRLIDNLEKMNEEYQHASLQVDRLRSSTSKILGVFLALSQAGRHKEDVKPLISDAIPGIIESHMQESGLELVVPEHFLLDKYRRKGIINDDLFTAVITSKFDTNA